MKASSNLSSIAAAVGFFIALTAVATATVVYADPSAADASPFTKLLWEAMANLEKYPF